MLVLFLVGDRVEPDAFGQPKTRTDVLNRVRLVKWRKLPWGNGKNKTRGKRVTFCVKLRVGVGQTHVIDRI